MPPPSQICHNSFKYGKYHRSIKSILNDKEIISDIVKYKIKANSENIWLYCALTSSVIPYIQQIPLSTDFRQHVCYIFFLNRCPIFDESSKLTNTVVHGRSKVPRLISTLGRLLCMKQKLTKLLFIIGFEFCRVPSQLRFVATGQRTPITIRPRDTWP